MRGLRALKLGRTRGDGGARTGEGDPCGEFIIPMHFLDVFGEDYKNSQVSGIASLEDEMQPHLGQKIMNLLLAMLSLKYLWAILVERSSLGLRSEV